MRVGRYQDLNKEKPALLTQSGFFRYRTLDIKMIHVSFFIADTHVGVVRPAKGISIVKLITERSPDSLCCQGFFAVVYKNIT